ncbi:uncharacterized protein EDB91DRAFT_1246393 [Suillus paluster]|uniref:uncharacterized protein n=1 Tax=Suillus paluster TaxID=48578 RepID=UPI001B85DFFA|nr:uncharacterized protein EDB91DRAFT_1246393 [Suillus paluster]KAG1745516.1 hypothetical protein EDB91DRAFT_1246393 [Suillus paluster]
MDFAKLDDILEHIASQHRLPAREVLDRWLETRQVHVPNGWRLLNGIPCIIGGLTALLGTLEGQGRNFPWKTLPTILACHGCILQNYPENILMPGERCATVARSKGIHDLFVHERSVLADALKKDTLTIKSVTTLDARKDLMASCVPVIIREAPVGDPLIICGRREFADGRIDRLGLACLDDTSPSNSHPVSSRQWRPRVFIEVTLPPPSWRLNGTRECSPVLSTNDSSDLVLQITCLSPHAMATKDDGTVEDVEDGAEVDELLGLQETLFAFTERHLGVLTRRDTMSESHDLVYHLKEVSGKLMPHYSSSFSSPSTPSLSGFNPTDRIRTTIVKITWCATDF